MKSPDLSNTPKRQIYLRNALWYGGFWLLLTLWLRLCLPENIMGWERHQLFRFSTEYLMFFSTKPYPILLYLQAFFAQFGLYPLLGAMVMASLLTLGVGAWHRLTGRFWTGLVWTAFMLPLLSYVNLLWVLVWLVLLGGGLLIDLRRLSTAGRLGLTAGLALAGTFVLQENVVFALVFWSLIGGLHTRSWRDGLYGLAATVIGASAGLGLSVWIGYPYFYTIYLKKWMLISFSGFNLLPFPALFFKCPLTLQLWFYVGSSAGLCLPLINLIPQRSPVDNRKKTLLKHIGLAATVMILLLSAAYLNLRYQTEDFFLVDRLTAQGQSQKAAETAEQFFFQRTNPENRGAYTPIKGRIGKLGIPPAPFQSDLEEHSMVTILKINLLGNRQATNCIFAYNGSLYFPLLFPDGILHSSVPHYMAFFYTQHGFYAEALHILYDLVTSKYISTAVLEPLLWNSVVTGDYEPCRKFIRFFEQSLFHKDIARRYTAYLADTAKTALQPEIAAARLRLASRNHTVLAYQPDDNIYFRLLHGSSDNAAAYEYALTLWMIYKNHNRILAELPKIRQYYQTLPTHIQEAVLACFPADRLDEVPEDIDPRITARYSAFLQTYGLYKGGYTSFRKLKKGFENTYWYHLHFNEFKPLDTHPSGKAGEI